MVCINNALKATATSDVFSYSSGKELLYTLNVHFVPSVGVILRALEIFEEGLQECKWAFPKIKNILFFS